MSDNREMDISLLITFHGEGILAHTTLNSVERCRKYAESSGLKLEYIWVLDDADSETREVLFAHSASQANPKVVEVSHRDLGASRNSGIDVARGRAVAILDGDDYFSANWIEHAWNALIRFGDRAILHPEIVVNFGAHAAYGWQTDQLSPTFNRSGLFMNNYWTSWTFSARSTYIECPYMVTRPYETGFGYEDWHWNCETVAAGYIHRLVEGTVGFYRRKKTSLVNTTAAADAIIPRTELFSWNAVAGDAQ